MAINDIVAQTLREQQKKEDMQRTTLVALSKAGFFDVAAFYGGTCLRLFYGLERFSEDMDFSLLSKDSGFKLEDYFPAIIEEFKSQGREIEIKKKDKEGFGKVQSAFLKDNTAVYDLKFQTEKTPKIIIEVDYLPPLGFSTEMKQLDGVSVRTMLLSDLYAGKMHALIFRQWKTRVKGRDWYDFDWYVNHKIPLDFHHFAIRTMEFNGLKIGSEEQFKQLLYEKIEAVDFVQAKMDVNPFIEDKLSITHWSQDYFKGLVDKMVFLKTGDF